MLVCINLRSKKTCLATEEIIKLGTNFYFEVKHFIFYNKEYHSLSVKKKYQIIPICNWKIN